MFGFEISVLEIVVRGTVMYLALFAMLRFVLKREAGELGMPDVLLVVLLADASANAMSGSYETISEGLVLVGTIVFWSVALDWLSYHVGALRRVVRPGALPLVRDGRPLRRNLRRELITEEELISQLRLKGVDDIARVREAYREGDGKISVLTYPSGGASG